MEFMRLFRRDEPASSGVLQAGWTPSPAAPRTAPRAAIAAARQATPARMAAPAAVAMPELLTLFRPMRVEHLDSTGRQALARMFHGVSHAPGALQALRELVQDEPAAGSSLPGIIAAQHGLRARWLATASRCAARAPCIDGDPADLIAALGPASARGLAFACLMQELFASSGVAGRRRLDTLGNAVALACLLVDGFAVAAQRGDREGLQARVALAFIGPMALANRLPEGLLDRLPSEGFLQRSAAEQALLGVPSAEIGRMLMQTWGLPDAVVDDAGQVDAVLFAPQAAWTPGRAGTLALCYLAARLAERLSRDPELDPSHLDPLADTDPAMHQLRGYLRQPALAGVCDALRAPALGARVRALRRAAVTTAA
jgi:hypothetical protein